MVAINALLCMKIRAPGEQWISAKMKVWHPWQLKQARKGFRTKVRDWDFIVHRILNSYDWGIL